MSIMKRFFILFFMVFHVNTFAATAPADDLTQLLKNIQTIQANFNQVITDKKAKELQRSSGQMLMQRPGKFRWEIKKPNPQVIVTNGEKLWIYDPDLEQVTIRLLTKEVGDSPAMILSNHIGIDKAYNVMNSSDANKSLQWFLLKPKNMDNGFASVKLGFQKNEIREMILEDQMGQMTNIEFYNIKNNPQLASSLFVFQIPSNIDVIDETKKKR